MTLNERITNDMRGAMKTSDAELLGTIRMLRSALQNQQIALGHDLNDAEVIAVLEKQAKQRRDSVEQYRAGGREDLAANEARELVTIEGYLPQKMDGVEISNLVDEVIAATGATGISDMGRVIKAVMERAGGAADGKSVSDIVREKLS